MKKVPQKSSFKENLLSWSYVIFCCIFWCLLIFASLQLALYYRHTLLTYGFLNPEGVRIGVYIIIGAFLVLFVHKGQIKKIFRIKDVKVK